MRLIKRNIQNIKIFLISFLLLFSQLALPITALNQPVYAGAGSLSAVDHEGQKSDSSWLNGSVTEYSELDEINFRFTINTDGAADGSMEVRFTGNDTGGQPCLFFQQLFTLGSVNNVSGASPSVTTVGTPMVNGDEFVQVLDVSAGSAGSAIINYTLQLSGDAGACGGSSQYSRLGNSASPGDFGNIGAQNVPVPAKDIIVLPDITIFKSVDTDGDGTTDRSAFPNEWSFSLDGGTPISLSDPINGLVFEDVTEGVHTVTESGPDGFAFFGAGNDCEGQVIDGVWTFEIVPTTDTADLACNFWNQADDSPIGTIIIKKQTLPAGDSQSFEFTPSYGDSFALSDGETNDSGPLAPGIYSADEILPAGWDQTLAECDDDDSTPSSIVLADGEIVTCTFTNTKLAQLTVKKNAVPNDPQDFTFFSYLGDENPTEFNLDDDGNTANELDNEITFFVEPGDGYWLTEDQTDGWKLSDISCTSSKVANALSFEPGEEVTCTFTNNKLGSITITKEAVGDDGTFNFDMTGETLPADAELVTDSGDATETFLNIDPDNTYSISEVGQDDWSLYDVTCINENDVDKNPDSFTINNGGNVTCTFTNYKDSSLTLQKTVINDDGGEASASDWDLTALLDTKLIDEAPSISVSSGTNTVTMATETYTVPAGMYDLSEFSEQTSYTPSDSWICENAQLTDGDTVVVAIGADVVCTITNDDDAPTLTVVKNIVNDNGGLATVEDFDIRKDGTDLLFDDGVVDGDTTTYTSTPVVQSNTEYILTEVLEDTGYYGGIWNCSNDSEGEQEVSFTLSEGEDVTCTITNDDRQATLTLVKDLPNDNGGQATSDDFTVYIDGQESDWGSHSIDAGSYTISEASLPGYAGSEWYTDCNDKGEITLLPGENKTCTITNDDQQATLTLVKELPNDDGGQAISEDFVVYINGQESYWGSHEELDAGEYTISEDTPPGYTASDWYTDCAADGTITLLPGENKTCTITNDDIAPTVTVVKRTMPTESTQPFDFTVGNASSEDSQQFSLDTDESNLTGSTLPNEYTVTELKAGTIEISETPVDGWSNGVLVTCRNNILNFDNILQPLDVFVLPFLIESNTTDIQFDIGVGQDVTCVFTNIENGDVKVTKFLDVNENGRFDPGEETLEGWDINLERFDDKFIIPIDGDDQLISLDTVEPPTDDLMTKTTGEDGTVIFEDLIPSPQSIYVLSEELQDGWQQTGIYCEYDFRNDVGLSGGIFGTQNELRPRLPFGDDSYPVFVSPDEQLECFVGNTYEPVLEIAKSNDSAQPEVVGNSVAYTITVTVPEESGCVYREGFMFPYETTLSEEINGELPYFFRRSCETEAVIVIPGFTIQDEEVELPANEVMVTDLLPEGFEYVPGSWTADSNVRGDLKLGGITTEPTYASPGQWNLTNPGSPFLVPGEVVTLTYVAVIDTAVTNGDYPDTAFVEGYTNNDMQKIYGNLHFTGDNPFVGTQVTVTSVDVNEQGYVLGTRTLQVTGVPAILAPIFGAILAAGALLVVSNRKRRRFFRGFGKSLASLALALVLSISIFSSVFAAGFWTTNISTPEAFTTNGAVNIDYQVASTEALDTFDVSLLQDGSPILMQPVTTPYGDSGRFPITLTTEGSYTFQTSVLDNNGSETKLSNEVTVVFDKTAPTAPIYSGVTRSGDTYTVSFTAPTGDVSSVNVYTSTTTSFDLDASTKVGQVSVLPGGVGQFVYNASDSTQRYFAITAEDAAGNQSSAVGDETITTTVVTATPGDTNNLASDTSASATQGTVGDEAAQSGTGLEGVSDIASAEQIADDGSLVTAKNFVILLVILGAVYLVTNRIRKTS